MFLYIQNMIYGYQKMTFDIFFIILIRDYFRGGPCAKKQVVFSKSPLIFS